MRLSRFTAGLGVLTASAVGLALVPGVAVAAPAHAAPRHAVHLRANSHHRITAPEVLAPGLVHIVNDGSRPLAIVTTTRNDITSADILTALGHPSKKNAAKLKSLREVGEISGHQDTYARLTRGHDFVIDLTAYPFHKGGVQEFAVSGRTVNAAAPRSVLAVLTRNRTLSVPSQAQRGEFLHLVSRPSATALLLLEKVSTKATDAQVTYFLAHPSFDGLFDQSAKNYVPVTPVPFASEVPGHGSVYSRLPRSAGRYLLAELFLTGSGGNLRVGQVREITIK